MKKSQAVQALRPSIQAMFPRVDLEISLASPQSIADTTATNILWDTETADEDGMFSTALSADEIYVRSSGRYTITVNAIFASAANGARRILVYVNGVAVGQSVIPVTATSTAVRQSVACQPKLAVDDVVTIEAYQSSGGALNLTSATLEMTLR